MEGGRSQGPAKSFVTLFVPGGGRRQVHDEEAARRTSLRQGEGEGGGFEERDMSRPKFLLEGGGERGRRRPGKGSQEGRDDAFEEAAEPGKTDGGGLNKNTAGWRERGERKGGNDEKDTKALKHTHTRTRIRDEENFYTGRFTDASLHDACQALFLSPSPSAAEEQGGRRLRGGCTG